MASAPPNHADGDAAAPLSRASSAASELWALGETFMMTATAALAADVTAPEQRGAATSLRAQVGDLTFVVMPVMLGLIATSHSHAAAFGVTSACGLGATAAFWRLTSMVR